MPRHGCATSMPHEPALLVHQFQNPDKTESRHLSRGEFNRQWNAIERPAEPAYRLRVIVGQFETAAGLHDALDEQSDCRIALRIVCFEQLARRRRVERRKAEHEFTIDIHDFPRRHENINAARVSIENFRGLSDTVYQMLATVEKDEHSGMANRRTYFADGLGCFLPFTQG